MPALPTPDPGADAAERFVRDHLEHVVSDPVARSPRFRGGQSAADAALAAFDVAGYAARRNEVWPEARRGASALSPYIRHGLISLREAWDAVAGGPADDVRKFRDELLWQEFARHWYARLGDRTALGIRREIVASEPVDDAWDRSLNCLDLTVGELERDGWLVNQTRMWLASHWSIRRRAPWGDGENHFFRHLLDGSRAANRLGWQWTTGVGSSKHYGFSRWQVAKRARGLCDDCAHLHDCPIENWPDEPDTVTVERPVAVRRPDAGRLDGPAEPETDGTPEMVWLTAESLGDGDPASVAHEDLPVAFVFDEPLLGTLRLSSKRLVFLVECLAEIADRRDLRIHLGDPVAELEGISLAVTHAPVPGFVRRSTRLDVVVRHPWPWLARPGSGAVSSFSAWRRSVRAPR